jgi:hypothetical protein
MSNNPSKWDAIQRKWIENEDEFSRKDLEDRVVFWTCVLCFAIVMIAL